MTTTQKLAILKGWLWYNLGERQWACVAANGESPCKSGYGPRGDDSMEAMEFAVEQRYQDWLKNKPVRDAAAKQLQDSLDYANGVYVPASEVLAQ